MNDDEVIEPIADEVLDPGLEVAPDADSSEPAEKPATMDETLRAKFRELTADPENADAAKELKAAPAKKVEAKPGEPVRGADGKFAPKVEAAVDPKAAVEQKPAAAPVDVSIAKAPTSWKGTAQAKYDALDPEVKAEVHRREADFHNGLKQYRQDAETFKLLDAEIRPYEAMIRASGTSPQALIRDFFNTAYQFKTGTPEAKVETWLNIAKSWNIDTSLLPSVQERMEAGQPVVSPEYRQLEQRFNQLQETVSQRETREKDERENALRQEAEHISNETRAWAVGKENFTEPVRFKMAALIESGQAKDLDDAYEQVLWTIPEVRATRIAQQQEADRKLAAEKAATAKKAASTNVKPRGTPPAKPTTKVGTMEDTIREQYRKLTAAN